MTLEQFATTTIVRAVSRRDDTVRGSAVHALAAEPPRRQPSRGDVVLVHGDRDALSPPEVVERLVAALLDGSLLTVSGGPHAVNLSMPDTFACGVREFLDRPEHLGQGRSR